MEWIKLLTCDFSNLQDCRQEHAEGEVLSQDNPSAWDLVEVATIAGGMDSMEEYIANLNNNQKKEEWGK